MNNGDYEPMDIDSSSNSHTAMEISYNELICEDIIQKNVPQTENSTGIFSTEANFKKVKLFQVDMSTQKDKKCLKLNTFFAFVLVSIFVAVICNKVFNFSCYHEIDLKALKNSLASKVYGQSEAIENYVRALEAKPNSAILFLYGGTGVGKTLSVSLLLQELLIYTNIYHYTMPSFVNKYGTDLKFSLIFCDKWLIVVDDLNLGDKLVKPVLLDIIERSENLNKKVTIILVYNCDNTADMSVKCDNSFSSNLLEMFEDIKVFKHFIRFMPLTQDSLKQCIVNELEHKLISKVDMNKLMKNFNVTKDGCKGVHTKIRSIHTF